MRLSESEHNSKIALLTKTHLLTPPSERINWLPSLVVVQTRRSSLLCYNKHAICPPMSRRSKLWWYFVNTTILYHHLEYLNSDSFVCYPDF